MPEDDAKNETLCENRFSTSPIYSFFFSKFDNVIMKQHKVNINWKNQMCSYNKSTKNTSL